MAPTSAAVPLVGLESTAQMVILFYKFKRNSTFFLFIVVNSNEMQNKYAFFVDIDECRTNPCKNGATCLNTYGSYICTCALGWTGVNCESGMAKKITNNQMQLIVFRLTII